MPGTVDPRIVIVDIDEKSLQEEGRWPWRRDRLGLFLDRLFDALQGQGRRLRRGLRGARRELRACRCCRSLGSTELEGRPRIPVGAEGDRADARVRSHLRRKDARPSGRARATTSPTPEDGRSQRVGELPEPVLPKGVFQGRKYRGNQLDRLRRQPPRAAGSRCERRPLQPVAGRDGVIAACRCWRSMGAPTTNRCRWRSCGCLLGSPAVIPGFTDAPGRLRTYPGLEWLDVGHVRIPVDIEVTALVPYRGAKRQLPVHLRQRRAARAEADARRCWRTRSCWSGPRPGLAGPALDPGRRGLSRGGDPRQPDLGHAGRPHQAEAALRAGRRGRCCWPCPVWSWRWSCPCLILRSGHAGHGGGPGARWSVPTCVVWEHGQPGPAARLRRADDRCCCSR